MIKAPQTNHKAVGTPHHGRTARAVIDELVRRGFRCSDHGDHAALERDGLRVVVPGRDRDLPSRVARMVEFALERHLGAGWLSSPEVPARRRIGTILTADSGSVHVLNAFVFQQAPDEPWCAVLADEFALMGYGISREDALRDLKRAAALWMEVDATNVVLVTPTGI